MRGWVAGPRDRTARREGFDLGELFAGQWLCSERLVDLLERTHAERRHEPGLLAQYPADRELTQGDPPPLREALETGQAARGDDAGALREICARAKRYVRGSPGYQALTSANLR